MIQRSLKARRSSVISSTDAWYGPICASKSIHLCLSIINHMLNMPRNGKIDERFKTTYDKLLEIRNQLEKLTLTQAWSLRETDLYNYQRQLDRIDESRIDGNFEDAQGNKADLHTQRVKFDPLSHERCR